jgi:hypothetical protein
MSCALEYVLAIETTDVDNVSINRLLYWGSGIHARMITDPVWEKTITNPTAVVCGDYYAMVLANGDVFRAMTTSSPTLDVQHYAFVKLGLTGISRISVSRKFWCSAYSVDTCYGLSNYRVSASKYSEKSEMAELRELYAKLATNHREIRGKIISVSSTHPWKLVTTTRGLYLIWPPKANAEETGVYACTEMYTR